MHTASVMASMEHDDQALRCWYFQTGTCRAEDGCCPFVHDNKFKARPPECIFFINGHCRYDNKCMFFHDNGKMMNEDVRGDTNIPTMEVCTEEKRNKVPTEDVNGWRSGRRRNRVREVKPPGSTKKSTKTPAEKNSCEEVGLRVANRFDVLDD